MDRSAERRPHSCREVHGETASSKTMPGPEASGKQLSFFAVLFSPKGCDLEPVLVYYVMSIETASQLQVACRSVNSRLSTQSNVTPDTYLKDF